MKKVAHYIISILIFFAVLSFAACGAEPGEAEFPSDNQSTSPASDQSSTQLVLPTATEPLPMDTAEPLPTETAEPLPTETTETLPPESLPTDTPVPLPTATNPPPLPPATPTVETLIALLWPEYGEYRNPFLFKWIGPLDRTYEVTLRHPEQGYVITSGPISAIDWIVDIPAKQFGFWEWYVTDSSGAQSEVWTFLFQPHTGSGNNDASDQPIAPPPRDP